MKKRKFTETRWPLVIIITIFFVLFGVIMAILGGDMIINRLSVEDALKELGYNSADSIICENKQTGMQDLRNNLIPEKKMLDGKICRIFTDKNKYFKILQIYIGSGVGGAAYRCYIFEKKGDVWVYWNDVKIPITITNDFVIHSTKKGHMSFSIDVFVSRKMGGPTMCSKDKYELSEKNLVKISFKEYKDGE